MRTWRRAPLALATGIGVLVAGTGCTEDTPPEPPDSATPRPPTAYTGQRLPGVAEEPVRYLHGPGSPSPDILNDSMGVRIDSVGNAFLISSNSEERHVLKRASDGAAVWEGEQRIKGFDTDRDGAEVLVVAAEQEDQEGTGDRSGATGTTVLDDEGHTVWSGSDPREAYLDGVVVRRPKKWSADRPHGEFRVLDTEGEPIWELTFERKPNGEADSDDADSGDAPQAVDDPARMGVPVGARDDVLLLDNGDGLLQARDIGGEDTGDLLWSAAGDDPELAGADAVPRPLPKIVGSYELPADGATPSGDPTGSADPARTRTALLVRWSLPEEPSLLSLHDLRSGEVLWKLTEPGTNPVEGPFDTDPVQGTVHDTASRTLLLPQASGASPMIGVDLVRGEIRWRFDEAPENAISPMFALDGYVYGDARAAGDTETSQVVLDARTKDVVAENLGAYVETVTDDGHTIVVHDRQRFVFPPAEPPAPTRSPTPT